MVKKVLAIIGSITLLYGTSMDIENSNLFDSTNTYTSYAASALFIFNKTDKKLVLNRFFIEFFECRVVRNIFRYYTFKFSNNFQFIVFGKLR